MRSQIAQGARQQSRLQDLQSHLERLTREKMTLEAKIGELSQYQSEVVALRNEIAKLQVRVHSDDATDLTTDAGGTSGCVCCVCECFLRVYFSWTMRHQERPEIK